MNDNTRNENRFIGYEYRDVTTSRAMETVYADGYENFGWILEASAPAVNKPFSVVLKFKRDRKLLNKAELTRLQRQFDCCVNEIETLERSKLLRASAIAYILGVLGTAFMAGAVFAYLAGMLPLCIILSVPGFAGWIVPYWCYSAIRRKKTDEVNPLIDSKYDELYEVCEKAHSLLTG